MKLTSSRILIVDDADNTRMLLKHSLRAIGVTEIHSAIDGHEAARMIDCHDFDIILCDWNMPMMSGLDLLQHVRSHERANSLPFIMLTAENAMDKVVAAMEQGVTDYIVKPWTLEILSKKLEGKLKPE